MHKRVTLIYLQQISAIKVLIVTLLVISQLESTVIIVITSVTY